MAGNTIACVARKEVKEAVRDGRFRLLGAIVVVLTVAALVFGATQTLDAEHAREHAQEAAAAQWEGQGDKNPHVAAHYGTHVFAPTSVATAIDPGVSAYLGRSVKIEAHRRNLAAHASAQDGGAGQGAFSVAMVLLQLVPLLIIALGYGLWSREREMGTLRQALSTGVDRRTLFWGKALALGGLVGALLLPAGMLIVGVLWSLGGGDGATLARLGLLGLSYGVYFAIFCGLTLFVSARARASRGALVALVAVWGFFCLLMPRAATELASVAAPLPSQASMARDVAKSLNTGIDGTAEREAAIEAIVSDMLAEQGFSDTGLLVDDSVTTGVELRAEAHWEDMVYDHHVEALEDQIQVQEDWVALAGALSPYVAMRTLSAGLCGTDFVHHRHFTDYAEAWRKDLVTQLNQAFVDNAGAEGWNYKAGAELWSQAAPFDYAPPGPGFALKTHGSSLAILLGWLLLALGLARWSARKVRVV